MKISAEINPSNSSHLRQGVTKISHSHKYEKVIVFTDDFLVINLLINRKVTENYLLLLRSVYYNYLYLKILTVYYLLHAITLKFSLLPITFLLPITYYSMSGTIHIDNIPAMQPNAEA